MSGKKGKPVEIPADLSEMSDGDLTALKEAAVAEFDGLDKDENLDVTGLERMTELTEGIEGIDAELGARATAAAERESKRSELRSRVHVETGDGEEGDVDDDGETVETAEPPVEAVVAGGRRRSEPILKEPRERLNVRLSTASNAQPSNARVPLDKRFDRTVLVASSDIPGKAPGSEIADMYELGDVYAKRGRAIAPTAALRGNKEIRGRYVDMNSGRGLDSDNCNAYGVVGYDGDWRQVPRYPVASLVRDFRYTLDPTDTPEKSWEIMQQAARPDALVAAGGWCSPSEISYNFYNVVAMDGGFDLPTTGIRRGGMRWPTSPSFGDLASSAGLWHWTEQQDIAAATGTAQSGSKTCARVPCAAFNEARLEGEGICITAGNLTTDAWPEQISNFMRLVNATHFHRVNSFFISNVITGSTAVTLTQTLSSPATDILAGVEHQVWDIRTKYAMQDTDILEVVFPSWVLGLIRADISRRNGLDSPSSAFVVTNAQIASWFSERYVRVQFVQDFDVRGANQFGQSTPLATAWPATVRFLIYPAGTWVRGNGMSLDLGIIRDSTLNATNDYTAAWSEEFFLLAKVGHESRIVTLGASANVPTGVTGALVTATGV